jgi:hypothetical protein
MPIDITINNISGSSPFDVYICDDPISTCIYIDTITSGDLPYTFMVPIILENQTDFNLKIVDDNDCTITENLTT